MCWLDNFFLLGLCPGKCFKIPTELDVFSPACDGEDAIKKI